MVNDIICIYRHIDIYIYRYIDISYMMVNDIVSGKVQWWFNSKDVIFRKT